MTKIPAGGNYLSTIFVFGVLVLVAITILAYDENKELIKVSNSIVNSHQVIEASNQIQINLNKASSIVHRLLLTSQAIQLSKLSDLTNTHLIHIKNISTLTRDNPIQQNSIAQLQKQTLAYQAVLQEIIDLYQKKGKTDFVLLSRLKTEQNIIDEITSLLDQITQEETRLLKLRNALTTTDTNKNNMILMAILMTGITLFLLSISLMNYYQKIHRMGESTREELENLLKKIIDSSDDLIAAVDSNACFIAFNSAYQKKILKRFGKHLLIGSKLKDIFSSPESQPLLQIWENALSGQEFTITTNFEENKRKSHYYEASYKLMKDTNGRVIGASHIMRDITERHKVEQLKNEFVSIVSHELRTPLTSIKGSLGLLLGGAISKLDEKTTSLLNIAYNNCERLVNLINDILDIEKMEKGKIELRLERINLAKLLKESALSNQNYRPNDLTPIVLEITEGDLLVAGDYARIMQVMDNLISNAIKFSPPGEMITISLMRDGNFAKVSVIDHGNGVPEEFHKHIFKKFTQADSASIRKYGGSGLGLSISKTIIEKMGGRIGYESRRNVGSTFYFELPILED